jgi:TonB family protein
VSADLPDKQEPAAQLAPLSLTASDGTGLELVAMAARAVVTGPLAFTELHLTFRNPKPRQIEGRFAITLPEGAAISRLAMKIRDHWQEAEVVERQAARRIYEDFLHRRQDPALLEKKAGNEFRARIFPIPARGLKELKVSFSQELVSEPSAAAPYRLHLKGLPRMRSLAITAMVGREQSGKSASSLGGTVIQHEVVQVKKQDYKPDRDFEVAPRSRVAGLRHDNLVVARITPTMTKGGSFVQLPGLTILVDTSASRAAGFAAQVERLGALVRALATSQGDDLPLEVACFDQAVAPVFRGPVSAFAKQHLDRILVRRALGASDVAGALRWAEQNARHKRLLLVTDAVATAGEREGDAIRKAVGRLRGRVERVDLLLVGGIRDTAMARRIVSGNLERDGVVLDEALGSAVMATRLGQVTLSGVEVDVPGARWVWPSRLDGVQPGQEHLIYADLPAGAARGQVTVKLSGPLSQEHRVQPVETKRPLLERAWIQARIARLEHLRDALPDAAGKDRAEAAKIRKQIIDLSTEFRVLSDHTALLVLETERDYRRYNLARRGLADILVVGASGIEVMRRGKHAPVARPASRRRSRSLDDLVSRATGRPPAPGGPPAARPSGSSVGDASGLGGLGLKGTGRGGGGTGEGKIGLGSLGTIGRGVGGGSGAGYGRGVGRLRGRRGRAPRIIAGRAEVRGSLDREIIRRIIRRHINEVKYCYQRELARSPNLTGRVTIRFVIAASGQVVQSSVASSTLGNASVERCISSAVRRWLFPKPRGGGVVIVSYPFVLRTTGSGSVVGNPPTSPGRIGRPSRPTWSKSVPALKGRLRELTRLRRRGKLEQALAGALRWRAEKPGDVLALVALGEALAALGKPRLAARAFGSVIDLFPSRADMRRFAGGRLEALGQAGRALAVDTYEAAVEQRPDHPNSHRMLAYGLLRLGRLERAFDALKAGLTRHYPGGRFAGAKRIMREDLGLIAAACF